MMGTWTGGCPQNGGSELLTHSTRLRGKGNRNIYERTPLIPGEDNPRTLHVLHNIDTIQE